MLLVQPDITTWAALLAEFEGCKLKAYLDSGRVVTIGFGTTYRYDLGRKVKMGDAITMAKAQEYLEHDTQDVVRQANYYIKTKLLSHQSTGICDYIYNRGIGNFLKANYHGWDLDTLINDDPYDKRIGQVIKGTGLWDRLGNFKNGLQRRRNCEAWLIETGKIRFKF